MAETETAARQSGKRRPQQPAQVGTTVNDEPLPGMDQQPGHERDEAIEAAARAYDAAKNRRVDATRDEVSTQKTLAGLMQHRGWSEYRGGGIHVHPKAETNPKPVKFVVEPDTDSEEEGKPLGAAGAGAAPSNVSAD